MSYQDEIEICNNANLCLQNCWMRARTHLSNKKQQKKQVIYFAHLSLNLVYRMFYLFISLMTVPVNETETKCSFD